MSRTEKLLQLSETTMGYIPMRMLSGLLFEKRYGQFDGNPHPKPQTRNGLHPPSLKLGVFGLLKGYRMGWCAAQTASLLPGLGIIHDKRLLGGIAALAVALLAFSLVGM
jgi:hypothetical protein